MNNSLTQRNNEEILSCIIGPQAASVICQHYDSLTAVQRADPGDLYNLTGIGCVRVTQIRAALELAGRLTREVLGDTPVLDQPDKVADYLREEVRAYTTETLIVLLLNTRRRLIRSVQIATGTLDTLLVHSREVFRAAIASNASAIILCHNHNGGGDPTPSEADIKVTRDLIRAGQLLKIEVIDHVILGTKTESRSKDYSSLRELGYFYS
jgi:DNA repair protein RadC